MKSLEIKIDGVSYKIPYCSNFNLAEVNYSQTAIFVIHGDSRNADEYYQYLQVAADKAHDDSTLIIAPHFPIDDDIKTFGLTSDTLYWSDHGWKQGNKSQGEGRISSFSVLEQAILAVVRVAPNLKRIIITGHSAGGQFVNRFTAGNSIEDELPNIRFVYAPVNPSTYLYFSPHRVVDGTDRVFEIPSASDCAGYDDYKYGVQNLAKTGYMASVGQDGLLLNYARRHVTYMLGENDTKTSSNSLDTSCEAAYQGPNRLTRGIIYYNYLGFLYGPGIYQNHKKELIPRVGHDAKRMYQSETLRKYLFTR